LPGEANQVHRIVGVDVGGTFTDVVVLAGGVLTGHKVPTTGDQAEGVIAAMGQAGLGSGDVFLHGTTVGTNALLEGTGARVALVTSKGFEDVVEIGRQARPSLYDSFADRPPPLVPPDLRFGYDGDFPGLLRLVREASPEAIAVAFVRSYVDSSDEVDLANRLGTEVGVPVSAAAVVSPEFREYERVATTVLDAYLTPVLGRYLSRLDAGLETTQRLVMTSSGGLLPFAPAARSTGRLVLSGPAAGVVAATALGQAKGHASVISLDMGGTSTDVCRIDGRGLATAQRRIGGRVNRVPSLPVRTIGAGGGSLAWVDDGGALRVGPRSAGADPGPAAYGRGGVGATVTDANLVLGRIPSSLALGGSIDLDLDAARAALGVIGERVGLGVDAVAEGIIEIVDTHMERALRAVSVEEGADPRDSVLVAFGGAGALHATRMARRLGIRKTLVPPLSGVFSALGLLLARPVSDAAKTVMLDDGDGALATTRQEILAAARSTFSTDHGRAPDREAVWADVRYIGQSHELTVPLGADWPGLRKSFEDLHLARFGFTRAREPIEMVNVRAEVTGQPPITWADIPKLKERPGGYGIGGTVLSREQMAPGDRIVGPAVVVEPDSALWLEDGDVLTVHEDGTLQIDN
jgi:N-methylhydantoinase A